MEETVSSLSLIETQKAIKLIKDTFEKKLAEALKLVRVSAPLFVFPESGLNDNLNGVERTVRFDVKALNREVEIVQSLAKWKRMALKKYGFGVHEGLYTDMNAIRRDEDLDAIHSVYVDQWDWERVIEASDRTLDYLKETVRTIYAALKATEKVVSETYPALRPTLPEEITFVFSEDAEREYPNLSRKEREDALTKKYGAVFLIGIGWDLKDGKPHDGRAADYDDWTLNGDLLLENDVLHRAFEISSMGIRVDGTALKKQLEKRNETFKTENPYCQDVLSGDLPLTIGGGIGQSRLCMFFLKKKHIGEVQASVWDEKEAEDLKQDGIFLL